MENNNRQGCRWTKASERLPKKQAHARWDTELGLLTNFESFLEFSGRGFFRSYHDRNNPDLKEIEWLDESIEPCATSSENYWKQRCEAAEKVFDSFPINLCIAKNGENKALKNWVQIKNQSLKK